MMKSVRVFACLSFISFAMFGSISCNSKKTYSAILLGEEITGTKLEQYEKEEKDFNEYSSQGGVLYEYKEQGRIIARVAYLFGEMGKVKYTFEPKEDGIVFVVKSEYTYDKSIYEGDVEITTIDKSKYILHKEKVYQLIDRRVEEAMDTNIKEVYELVLNMK